MFTVGEGGKDKISLFVGLLGGFSHKVKLKRLGVVSSQRCLSNNRSICIQLALCDKKSNIT